VALAGQVRDEALPFLHQYQARIAIVSNNSTDLPAHLSDRLRAQGVKIDPSRVLLAGAETIARAWEAGVRQPFLIGGQKMRALARSIGMRLDSTSPDAVLLLRDQFFSQAKLALAANLIRRGVTFIASNPDRSHPGRQGQLVPETGAFLEAVAYAACVDRARVEVVGKPGPRLFQRACAALRCEPRQAIMIGDNPETDLAGAAALGMPSLLLTPFGGRDFPQILASTSAPIPSELPLS
jgi:HAD superfamily hydrolase (TIGR01450 family)